MNKNLFIKSEKANENYLSKIIKIDNVRPHPNAEKLDIITIDGANVIIAKGLIKVGDIMVYCATESSLNKDFLSKNNQFEDKELNVDPNVKGYFNNKGRVRAINLRGETSRAFICHPDYLKVWQPEININNIEDYIGIEFDYVNGVEFSKKYIPFEQKVRNKERNGQSNKRNKHLKRFDRLIENQFKFHIDTGFLAKNLHKIDPDDIIQISAKWHGTSSISANILVNRELKWWEVLLKKFGVKMVEKVYGDVISSRSVIKNRYINREMGSGYYSVDVWNEAHKQILPLLPKGITVYYEICGYLPNSQKMIQKNHDYGCKEGEFTIRVYRVTYTNPDGLVLEFSANQVQEWCVSMGLIPVKELYYGKAKDVYPDLDVSNHWHQNFLDRLKNDKTRFFMELDDPDCKNSVPFEGIVIRKEGLELNVWKLKTDRHYGFETAELDKGELDIETAETISDDESEEA